MNSKNAKRKKVYMFLEQKGKCGYCDCDMVLSFQEYFEAPNLATFDHLYNRDHPERGEAFGEKRIFLVCKKCNTEKSKGEPNNQEQNTPIKTAKKIVPKRLWTDEETMNHIAKVLEEESELSRSITNCDKQIGASQNEKIRFRAALSKKVLYRKSLEDRIKQTV